MEKPENPVRILNGSCHLVWEASENNGCDLRCCNFPTLFSLLSWFNYLDILFCRLFSNHLKFSSSAYDERMWNNRLKNQQKSTQQESLFIESQKKNKHSSRILLFIHAGKTTIHCQKKKKSREKSRNKKKPVLMHKCSFPDNEMMSQMMSQIK